MAVGAAYLSKAKTALRVKNPSAEITQEITDNIETCRADLISLGVLSSVANDETNYGILGAVKSYLRWQMAPTPEEGAANQENYMTMRDELRRKAAYIEAVEA